MWSRWSAALFGVAGTAAAILVFAGSASATFPGKNGRIAFTAQGNVHTVNPDGTGLAQLTTQTLDLLGASLPRWSPDGRRIAYRQDVRVCDGEHGDCRSVSSIRVMNADGTGQIELRRNLDNITALTWSPDGSQIAFSVALDPSPVVAFGRIRVMNADGSGLRDLGFGNYPAWSPDGNRIAFIGASPVGFRINFEVFTIRPDGTDSTRLTHQEPRQGDTFKAPSWSPDGSRLVFFMERPDLDLFTINADGTGFRNITNSSCFPPEGGCEMFPVWSPDGASVLFVKLLPTTFATVRPDGSDLMRLPHPAISFSALDQLIDWQPLPGPRRADFKNAAKFCSAERDFWGESEFRARYATNRNGANAFGKCVSRS